MYSTPPGVRAAALVLLASGALALALVPAAGATAAGPLDDDPDEDANDSLVSVELDAADALETGSGDGDANESVSVTAETTLEEGDESLSADTVVDATGDAEVDATVDAEDGIDASADAEASTDSADVAATVDAGTDGGLAASANATIGSINLSTALHAPTAGNVDVSTNVSIGPTADAGPSTAPGGERTEVARADEGSEPDRNTRQEVGTDGDGDDSGHPMPGDAGAGLAVGTLVVGGGVLGRRALSVPTASAAAPVATGVLDLLRAWWWRLLAVAGYHRYEDSDPLEQETRAAVYAHLRESPGASRTELSEVADVPVSTLRYHLRVLAFEDLVTSVTVRGKRRYFPADAEPAALEPALADEATAAVLEALATAPDSVSGLADRLDRDPSTVSHHLQRLDEEGLVERERQGRSVVTRLADHVDETAVEAATAATATTSAD